MANAPYIKSGCANPPQQIQKTKSERVYFEMYSAAGALLNTAVAATALVTFKDQAGTVIVDNGAVSLEDVVLTNQSTGIYYYLVTLDPDETATVIYAFPSGNLDLTPTTIDVPIAILVRSEEQVESTENYCDVSDMASFTGRDYTTDSRPTLNEVQEAIDFICGQMNDYLKNSYTVPITGARALSQLKMIAKIGIAAIVEKSTPRGNADRAAEWRREYNQYLKEIKAGTLPLTTTSAEGSGIADPNMANLVGGLGTDTSIDADDKAAHFSMDDEW